MYLSLLNTLQSLMANLALAAEQQWMYALAAAIAFAGGALGAGIAIAFTGSAAISAAVEDPKTKVWGLIITALGEAIAIYAFVMAYMILMMGG